MLPFYIFYSMFGFQRIGDLRLAGRRLTRTRLPARGDGGPHDALRRGLQHQDGSSQLIASTLPNCVAYDPCFGYELAVIMQDGMRRMLRRRKTFSITSP
jgi:pyruvate dehydrogenase E1 component